MSKCMCVDLPTKEAHNPALPGKLVNQTKRGCVLGTDEKTSRGSRKITDGSITIYLICMAM